MRARILGLVLFAAGCAKDLRPPQEQDGGMPPPMGHFTTTANADGTFTSLVEATSETEWRYFDFETRMEVEPASPETSLDWDIAFQRFRVKTNGGFSGTGGAEVAVLPGADFAATAGAPVGPYILDAPDGDDEESIPDYAFNVGNSKSTLGWYAYDPTSHALMPADLVYVAKSAGGHYFKIKFVDYYDDAGSSGYPKFQFGMVTAPTSSDTLSVDVAGSGYVRISIATRSIVTVADPNMSSEWDLGVDEAAWQTNSGGARVGLGGAKPATSNIPYAEITEAGTVGYARDVTMPFPGPPGSGNFLGSPVLITWFDYDEMAHTATSKQLVYLIRTANGGYGKMQIVNYDNATKVYTVKVDPLTRRVENTRATIDASDRMSFKYFSLRLGTEVEVMDPITSREWDLALSGVRVQTNSGTSGGGEGGAQAPGATTLDELTVAPTDGYDVDAMIADPAGGMYSGNGALAGWYSYSAGTGTTAKDLAYLVRTADGDYAKVKITGWTDGTFTLDWAYTGPNETSF